MSSKRRHRTLGVASLLALVVALVTVVVVTLRWSGEDEGDAAAVDVGVPVGPDTSSESAASITDPAVSESPSAVSETAPQVAGPQNFIETFDGQPAAPQPW